MLSKLATAGRVSRRAAGSRRLLSARAAGGRQNRGGGHRTSAGAGSRTAATAAAAAAAAAGLIAYELSDAEVAHAAADSGDKVDFKAVREDIAALLDDVDFDDGSWGPVFVRLAWHASGTFSAADGTGGSHAMGIRKRELGYGCNAGLHLAIKRLESVKQKHANLSYADLYTLAGVVAISEMGGPDVPWKGGRKDDEEAGVEDGRLPDGAKGQDHVRSIFYRMGFTDRDIVALSGAHALGRCHKDRSGFDGPWTNAPTTFSNEYHRLLIEETWTKRTLDSGIEQYRDSTGQLMMLPSDMALVFDDKFKKYVEIYAKNEDVFFKDFADAFGRLIDFGRKPEPAKGLWAKIFG